MRLCSFPDCSNKHDSKGLCAGHKAQENKGQELTRLRVYRYTTETCLECDSLPKAKGLCQKHYQRRTYNATENRKYLLKRKYGINEAQYMTLLESQNYSCAICGVLNGHDTGSRWFGKLVVDHCHVTGKIRGLLCDKCNRALGLFQDSEYIVKKAGQYLCMS